MNRSKAKGTAAETAVVTYLQKWGYPDAERRALHGALDQGDVAGVSGVVVEVKNCKAMALAEWVDEAGDEASNADAPIGVVWHKRRGFTSPSFWYVTMEGHTFIKLLNRKTA